MFLQPLFRAPFTQPSPSNFSPPLRATSFSSRKTSLSSKTRLPLVRPPVAELPGPLFCFVPRPSLIPSPPGLSVYPRSAALRRWASPGSCAAFLRKRFTALSFASLSHLWCFDRDGWASFVISIKLLRVLPTATGIA